jgi:hypothetical protein
VPARPAFELADVFRRHGDAYIQANAGHLGRIERRVIGAVVACRTSALGGHVERCDECGLTRIAYDSCRNRHCPKCQAAARAEWLAARQAELLPVPYFHVVFTLPPAAAKIAFQNKQTVYGLLMRAAAQALMTLAAERLGAKIGLIALLHTWGQTLTHHPHVHCLVPGGGVALDGQRWVACKPNFLLSVRALSKTFRRLFLDGLEAAFRRGELGFFGDLVPLADVAAFAQRVRALRQSSFVVYAKPPFGGPERVLAYLARYTHRTAIANSRLAAADDNEVAFSYKDYRRGGRSGVMRLAPHAFHPPLSPPRPARRLPPHSALRLSRQGRPRRDPRARAPPASSRAAQRARRCRPRRTGRPRRPRAIRRLPGLRRSHAARRPCRRIAGHRFPLRHIMISSLGPTSITRRRPAEPQALTLLAIAASLRPASAATASLPRLQKAPQIPAAAPSNRSTVSSCQTSQCKQRLENQDRPALSP